MNIICLDTEFTGLSKDNEILQLAILDGNGNTVINELYRPEKAKSWPFSQKVHNISPQMVKDKPSFVSERSRLQRYFDDADLIVGFAIENDTRELSRSGIEGLSGDRCFDVRDLYWAVPGKEQGIGVYNVPSLIKCSEECGFDWSDESAHSADADSLATLHLFWVLIRKFAEKYDIRPAGEFLDDGHIRVLLEKLARLKQAEIARLAEENAKGLLYLFKRDGDYRLYSRRDEMDEETMAAKVASGYQLVAMIAVNDRWKGHFELVKKFERKQIKGHGTDAVWRLSSKDIKIFETYTNTFTSNSKVFKSLLEHYHRFS